MYVDIIPEGRASDDHTSRATLSGLKGGQFMTGDVVLPESTGPKPLLRPATATNTTYRKRQRGKKEKLAINKK